MKMSSGCAPAVLPVPTKTEVPSLDGPPGAQMAAKATQNEAGHWLAMRMSPMPQEYSAGCTWERRRDGLLSCAACLIARQALTVDQAVCSRCSWIYWWHPDNFAAANDCARICISR